MTAVIATFGDDDRYVRLAHERAIPSVDRQGVSFVYAHRDALHDARNDGAAAADTEWLVFLDADDELAPGYFDALSRASGDLRAPAVSYVHGGHPDPPVTLDDRDIATLNPCVIGTAVHRDLFHQVGGFGTEPVYEDWALWLRCVNAGATITHVPDAVYLAHVNPAGRNSQPADLRRRAYRDIRRRLVL